MGNSAMLGFNSPERSGSISFGSQTNAWPVNPENFDTLIETLDRIRQIGFTGFETGFRNLEKTKNQIPAARKRIEETGLVFYGVHIFLRHYDEQTGIAPAELYQDVIRNGTALGARHLILSGHASSSVEKAQRKASALNEAGKFAKALGASVAYHNHSAEFDRGGEEIQTLLASTDPSLVGFLVDAGHAFLGGVDVPTFLQENAGRVVGLHLRAFLNGTQVPLGQGIFSLGAVASTLKADRWTGWVLTEEERTDGSKPGDSAVRPACEALQKAFSAGVLR